MKNKILFGVLVLVAVSTVIGFYTLMASQMLGFVLIALILNREIVNKNKYELGSGIVIVGMLLINTAALLTDINSGAGFLTLFDVIAGVVIAKYYNESNKNLSI